MTPAFTPCWPVGAFESLPDELLGKICTMAGLGRCVLPGDMQCDVRRLAFVSKTILHRLCRVRPAIWIRAYSGGGAAD